jgi:hypothetical protein
VQEAYHEMLVKFREELTRPLQEAMEFMRRVESQLNSLSISGRSLRNILSSGIEKIAASINQISASFLPLAVPGLFLEWAAAFLVYLHAVFLLGYLPVCRYLICIRKKNK